MYDLQMVNQLIFQILIILIYNYRYIIQYAFFIMFLNLIYLFLLVALVILQIWQPSAYHSFIYHNQHLYLDINLIITIIINANYNHI